MAEVAAVERTGDEAEAAEGGDGEGDEDGRAEDDEHDAPILSIAAPPPPPAAEGPIIVEPASWARGADSEAVAEETRPPIVERRGEKLGYIKLGEGAFALPGTDMLEYLPPESHEMDKQSLYDMAERLEQAMSNYGVRGKVKEIHMGPVVTMYEFAPAPGTPPQDRRPRERPGDGARGAGRAHRGADSRQGGGRHRGAEPERARPCT